VRKARIWTTALVTLAIAAVLAIAGAIVVVYTGAYNIAATEPHTRPARTFLRSVSRNSVQQHARGVEVPNLDDPQLIRKGFGLYQELCVTCHGAPGVAKSRIGIGMNPNPPPLEDAVRNWSTAEIYWIIENGLKMAGMPAFGIGEAPRDTWALTAFVVRMNTLTPVAYAELERQAADPDPDVVASIEWVARTDIHGWDSLKQHGDAEHGRRLIDELGCGTCHRVPGVRSARGRVAPPLDRWSRRHFLAGVELNTPAMLVAWIVNPQAVKPGTAMPHVNATELDGWHIARYLFSLE
jgi:mono/diheme cytochrome c family protein/cytochrome c2